MLDNDWEKSDKVTAFLASSYNHDSDSKIELKTDSLHILATAIDKANIEDINEFTLLTQFNIKEPKTYKQAMYRSHKQQWVQAIKKKLDQLKKAKTSTLISKQIIHSWHKLMSKNVFSR